MMKQEVKKKWIKALRSGEYKQTRERLKDNKGYCCLGVLCDLFVKENPKFSWVENKPGEFYLADSGYYLSGVQLPRVVQDWAGLESSNPSVKGTNLIFANDKTEFSFKSISELIEEDEEL